MRKKVNSKSKPLTCILASIAIPFVINTVIFSKVKKTPQANQREDFYSWQHGEVHYIVRGSGRPLLLIHDVGIGSDHHEWERSIAALSKHFKVYALDLLGFGHSSKSKTTYTAYLYTQLVNDFIRDVIKAPVNIIASNTSAAFCVMAYTLKPSLYEKMMIISPSGLTDKMPSTSDRWTKLLLQMPIIGTTVHNILACKTALRCHLKNKVFNKQSPVSDSLVNRYHAFAHIGGPASRYATASLMSNYMNTDIKAALAQFKIPLFVAWGQNNSLRPSSLLGVVAAMTPGVQTAVFEQVGLYPHVENSVAFYRLCKKFFS